MFILFCTIIILTIMIIAFKLFKKETNLSNNDDNSLSQDLLKVLKDGIH